LNKTFKIFSPKFLIINLILIGIISFRSPAQESSDSVDLSRDTSKVKLFEMQKSPLLAVGLSLLLPGSGQVYVGSYWKAPLFLGGACALGYTIYYFNRKYWDTQNLYDIIKSENNDDNLFMLDSLRRYKEYYRDNRDMSAFYLLGVYILAAVDAYVGAHLYDFTVSDDFTFIITPDIRYAPGISLMIKW
jgi:hypothetical protein